MNKSKYESLCSAHASNDIDQKHHYDKLIEIAKEKEVKRKKMFEEKERERLESCTLVPMTNSKK